MTVISQTCNYGKPDVPPKMHDLLTPHEVWDVFFTLRVSSVNAGFQ